MKTNKAPFLTYEYVDIATLNNLNIWQPIDLFLHVLETSIQDN